MGRKLNLGHLSDAECQHILAVVHKDFNIRFQEKERLRGIEEDVDAEETKYGVLSRSLVFNERHCICCFSRFLPLINPRVLCDICRFTVCKSCFEVDQTTNEKSCTACLKQRDLQKKSNDWFYSSVKKRFRRCGSAKVIRSLYKRRIAGSTDLSGCLSDDVGSASRNCLAIGGGEGGGSSRVASVRHLQRYSSAAVGDEQWKDGKSDDDDDDDDDEGDDNDDVGSDRFLPKIGRLRADSCMQTEREGMRETGTMTTISESSRFFHCFDGMATVSTEGQELDPEFISRPHNVRVLEGEPLNVECKVNGTEPLDVLWFCNRNQVQQLEDDDRCEISRHGNAFTLTIYDMRHDDIGEFLCIAVNALGQCAQGFTVTVDDNAHAQLPPTFNNQTDNIEIVPEGSSAVLHCSVSAYPEPKVTWMRNNKPVMRGGRHRVERHVPDAFKYQLVIESVRADDSGCYVAVARNSAGESRLPIQLLIQPNPLNSEGCQAAAASSQPEPAFDTSDAELIRLAQDLSRAQGRFTTTAARMLRSADTMSSLQSQLDVMDKALEGLEEKVLDVLTDDDDDDDSNDEDSLNNNNNSNGRCSWHHIANEVDDMKSSAEAVGMVTSAALQLLSSAKEIAMETLTDSPGKTEKEEKQMEETEEDEEEEDDNNGEGVCAETLDLSYHELENLFKVGLISRSELKRRLIQPKNLKQIRLFLRQVASASGYQSEDSAMETSIDSLETVPEASGRERRSGKRQTTGAASVSSSGSSADGKRRSGEGADGREDVLEKESKMLKDTEQQIYLTSGKVFSLEDCVRDLEKKVLEVDEATPAETLVSLENSVARAVAQVTQSDNEVNEIERQVERWMEKSGRATNRCNDRFRAEQHKQQQQLLQLAITSSSSPDNHHQTESIIITTTPDSENNTTTEIVG